MPRIQTERINTEIYTLKPVMLLPFRKYLLLLSLVAGLKSFSQTDCTSAVSVCGNTNFQDLALSGFGGQEVASCGSEEHNSLWLKLHIVTSGTLAFDIIPESSDINEDFDFFLFRYQGSCDNLGQVRCSTTNPAAAALSSNVTGARDLDNDSFEGPGASGNSFVSSVDVIAGQTYMLVIDRPHGNSNFSLEWTGTATFDDSPALQLPPGVTTLDIMKCDLDGTPDNITLFDLTQNTPLIVGNQTGVAVDYYNSAGDAVLGANAIGDPQNYSNMSDPEIVYVRVSNGVTGCFVTSEFQIGINNEVALEKDQYTICDDAADGNAANGQAVFNMSDVTGTILPGFTAQGFTARYFLSQSDALTDSNQIGASFYNTVPGQQTVFVKADAGSCTSIKPVQLIVKTFPSVSPSTLVQCDFGPNPDGLSVFDLSVADSAFTASDPNLSVQYFENAAAVAANTPLPSVYTNISNPQDLIVKITDTSIGCSTTTTLTLTVNTVTPQQIAPLEVCDAGNGFAQFNLNNAAVLTTPQETIAFYVSLQDALLQQNHIGNIAGYTNPTAYQSTVFVRIDDSLNGCSGISEIKLRVNPLPVIEQTDEAVICINQPGSVVAINAGQLQPGQAYSYVWAFNNSVLAQTGYAINAGQPGTYTVDITNAQGCKSTRTIAVLPADVPAIGSVTVNGNSVILNVAGTNAIGYTFAIDQPNGPFQSGNYFADVPCGLHTAYVDGGNGCGTMAFAFKVAGIPAYFSPNGDAFADRWNVMCSESYPDTMLYIFDRYGKLIKQISASGLGWDGTYNGVALPSDDYWYILEAEDGTTTKGHFALKR